MDIYLAPLRELAGDCVEELYYRVFDMSAETPVAGDAERTKTTERTDYRQ